MARKSVRDLLEDLTKRTKNSIARIESLTKTVKQINSKRDLGWAQYTSTQYTEQAPLTIAVEDGPTILDINGGTTIKTYLPEGITDFYDVNTSKITPINIGDGYTFSIGFRASNTNNNGAASIGIDIGGSFGEIFKKDFRFPRGTGIIHDFYYTIQGYSLDTFVQNGGQIKITSKQGVVTMHNITLQIHRTSKAPE